MIDQLIIGNLASHDNFEASVKERKIVDGKKKSIRETVPFSNKVYDFSKIDGETYWEEKSLQYTFEITANSPEELSSKIIAFKAWVMNVTNQKLKDPYIMDYHFIATFSDISVDETEVEKATIAVTFSAYPYMIANEAKTCDIALVKDVKQIVSIVNNSSHRVTPTFTSNVAFTVTKGTESFSVPSGEITDEYFKLETGTTDLAFVSASDGTVKITFYEEVF